MKEERKLRNEGEGGDLEGDGDGERNRRTFITNFHNININTKEHIACVCI